MERTGSWVVRGLSDPYPKSKRVFLCSMSGGEKRKLNPKRLLRCMTTFESCSVVDEATAVRLVVGGTVNHPVNVTSLTGHDSTGRSASFNRAQFMRIKAYS